MPDIIRNGDHVYLSLDSGEEQFIATVYTGYVHWFPSVSSSKVRLKLSFDEGDELTEGQYVKLTNTEPRVGDNMHLSAYKTQENCYYWNADTPHQQWQVHSTTSEDGKVRYGDGLILTNIHFSPQRLVPEGSYLTTKVISDSYSTWYATKA